MPSPFPHAPGRPKNRIGFSLSTKDRTHFTEQILPGLDCGGFDLVWCDGSVTRGGRSFPSPSYFRNTPLKEICLDVGGGPDAAIQFSLRRLLELGYDYVGLIENDIQLKPGWLTAVLAAWKTAEKDGFKVGAVTARSIAGRVLARRPRYVVKWNLGAGMALFSRAGATAVLEDYQLTTAKKIHEFYYSHIGVDLADVWELFMDQPDRVLGADWHYAVSLLNRGLVAVGVMPNYAENIDVDVETACGTRYVCSAGQPLPKHCLTPEQLLQAVGGKKPIRIVIGRAKPVVMERAPIETEHSVERLLWVRTDSIGDAVLAASMLAPVRQKFPRARIAVLCQQHTADLYTACPWVDSIICYDRGRMDIASERQRILSEMAAFNPDVIVNSVHSRDKFSDDLTLAFADAKHVAVECNLDNISGADREVARRRYEEIIPVTHEPVTELKRHADFVRGLGIESPELQPVVWISADDEALADAFFQQRGLDPARTIALFPGAQHEMRVYHGYGRALKNLEGYRFLVFGDDSEGKLAEGLELELPGRTINLCGRSTLRETIALLKRCRLYVGAESAGAHIACAVGVPNVVLLGGGHFGRFMPYSPLTTAVSLPLDCFGCNWRCPHKRAHCIKDLTSETLAEAIEQTLAKSASRPRLFLQPAGTWAGGGTLPGWKRPADWIKELEMEVVEPKAVNSTAAATALGDELPPPDHERVCCPACGSRAAFRVRRSADIVQCRGCETVYLRTRLTRSAMASLYQSYADKGSHMALPKSLAEAERSGLKRDEFLDEILPMVKPGGNFLDVGCGWGAFLLNARSKGFSPRGIELTKACVDYANSELQIPVTDTQLDEIEITPGSLRVVTMNHVFEHLPDLRAALNKVMEALEPGGMFCGIVPNFASACSETPGDKWYWLDPNYHYQHFTPATLRRILESAGFGVEKIYTATGDYGAEAVGKACLPGNPQLEDHAYFKTELPRYEGAGRGEEIRFFARKPASTGITGQVSGEQGEIVLVPEFMAGPDPLVSVVVSAYQSEKFMRACLENLSHQTIFDRTEVIVVDLGSPENERAIVAEFQRKFPNVRYLRTPHETLYAAWNRALKLARGRYFANVNTDDSLRSDALGILSASLEKHTDCALSYADCAWTTTPNDTFPSCDVTRTVKYPDYTPIETLFYCITGCLQFFRTESLRQLGGYDASLRCAGDYEATLKLMTAGMNAVHVPEVLSLFFQNTTGLTQASNCAATEHDQVMNRYRANLDIANIFRVERGNPTTLANAWAMLGAWAAKFSVPWEDAPMEHYDFAFACLEKALRLDPANEAAGMILLAACHKLNRLHSREAELVARWPKMREWISAFRVGGGVCGAPVQPALLGPVYRPAESAIPSTAEPREPEPQVLRTWTAPIERRQRPVSDKSAPRPDELRDEAEALKSSVNRLAAMLSELPPF